MRALLRSTVGKSTWSAMLSPQAEAEAEAVGPLFDIWCWGCLRPSPLAHHHAERGAETPDAPVGDLERRRIGRRAWCSEILAMRQIAKKLTALYNASGVCPEALLVYAHKTLAHSKWKLMVPGGNEFTAPAHTRPIAHRPTQ